MGIFRAVSTEAVATQKTSDGLPDDLYRRISRIGDPKRSAVDELERWVMEGREVNKRVLIGIAKNLRKYFRHKHALEVIEWMSKKFPSTVGDRAMHLVLIAKVHGIASAEKYFGDLLHHEKNYLTYSALLNCYVQEKDIDKSEVTMEELKQLGFIKNAFPYSAMMTLYMNTEKFGKVPLVIQEMKKKGISVNICCYNIWMRSYAALSDLDGVAEVFNEIERDHNINTDWSIYSTIVNIYINAKVLDKAGSALKEMENKVKEIETKRKRKDELAYNHLISLHGNLGNKDEVYRIWRSFELASPKMTNTSYICLLSSLIRMGDIEGAEFFFKEWESLKTFDDSRVYYTLINAYVEKRWLEKAELLLERVVDKGGKPNARTWEALAEGYIENDQIQKAMEAMKKSLSIEGNSPWQPNSVNVLAILKHFQKQGDVKSAEEFFKILRCVKFVSTEIYNSYLRTYVYAGKVHPGISELMLEDNVSPDEETDNLLKQIVES